MVNYSAFHWSEKARKYAEEAQKRGKALVFRGSVQTFEDLPTTADIGDMYDVLENGANYAWTGEKWDNLGGIFDTLPNQLGQEGKYLKTNGNEAYWDEALEKDDKTINLNADNKAQAIGVIEKNKGDVKYDWIGTLAEHKEQNIETLHQDWVCLVTDDVQQNPEDFTKDIKINNPFSLLDYKWSEYAINNSSWLISNSSFHSGTAYTAVYSLLLKIHNGTETKEGVSVKLSTEVYEDTDFVLNTADTTFRLPVKVLLASGNRVAGNGMTLGLTCDNENFGVIKSAETNTTNALEPNIQAYGTDVGTAVSFNAGTFTPRHSIGVTTDPIKSGIETSSQDLYLYFYVGETVQDANVIVASGVLTRVANSIDRTLSTDRETVVGWGMPDYTAEVNLGEPSTYQTLPCDCLVVYHKNSEGTLDSAGFYYANEDESFVREFRQTMSYSRTGLGLFISKGWKVKALDSGSTIRYYPLKGVN